MSNARPPRTSRSNSRSSRPMAVPARPANQNSGCSGIGVATAVMAVILVLLLMLLGIIPSPLGNAESTPAASATPPAGSTTLPLDSTPGPADTPTATPSPQPTPTATPTAISMADLDVERGVNLTIPGFSSIKNGQGEGQCLFNIPAPFPLTSACTAISSPLSFCYLPEKRMDINNPMPPECSGRICRPFPQSQAPDSGT